MDLTFFDNNNILESTSQFFSTVLNIKMAPAVRSEIIISEFLKEQLTDTRLLKKIKDARFIGMINSLTLEGKEMSQTSGDYDMLLVFGIELNQNIIPTKTDISRLTRALNRRSLNRPVVLILKYGSLISFSSAERGQYKQAGQQGEKIGRISILRDINIDKVHAGHERILLQLQIKPLKVSTFKDLYTQWLEVFNVNILNREFYSELFTWYSWAIRTVSFPNKVDDISDDTVYNSENVIRLLTRLIFIWFVKEKGLVSDELFDKNKVADTLKAFDPCAENNSDYYKAILQNLFFATLNTEMPKDGGERAFIDDSRKNRNTGYTEEYLDHLVYRYKDLFRDHNEGIKLFENIPFLNGGLFECLDRRDPETNAEIRIDGFSSTTKNQPVVPNVLFFGRIDDLDLSNEFEDSAKYKHCKARGIINILNSYKFTIEENTPLEQEIALDPELLGKIFENLLASYNPETRTTARKQTGSYYTPREIVNYMVDESLIAYLKSASTYDSETFEEQLRILFAYESEGNPFAGEPETIRKIITALSDCKILDPACGSGAFPMGILRKIVFVLGKLDPCNYTWKQAQLEKAQRDKQRAEQFEDNSLREVALKSAEEKIAYVEASFGETGHELDYARKLFLIENCIYGVDIQQIAIQISKLRFFISLMVDQRVDDSKPNRNILSLPNLETKFVAANTLIPADKPQQLMLKDPELEKTEKELHEIHQKIFFTRNYSDKKKLKNKELQTRKHLRKLYIEKAGYSKEAAEKITQWNPFDPLRAAPFFDSEIMFTIEKHQQNGYFDVVIGNPPYVQLQKNGGALSKQFEKIRYKTFERTGDIYSLFYEKGVELLKPQGHLIFITSNKWMRAGYGESTRKFFAENTNPVLLIDFAGQRIFDAATVDTNILMLSKEKNQQKTRACTVKEKVLNNLSVFISQSGTECNFSASESWVILTSIEQSIKAKIEAVGTPLKDWDINIYRGILTGYNEAFIINGKKKEELIAEDPKSAEIIRPILRGRDIDRYSYEWAGLYVILAYYNSHKILEKSYPAIYNHLLRYRLQLERRGQCRYASSGKINKNTEYPGQHHWLELDNNPTLEKLEDFSKQKIIWGEISDRTKFCIDLDGKFTTEATTFLMTGQSLLYLLGFLNSKLSEYFFSKIGTTTGVGTVRWKKYTIEQLRVPVVSPKRQIEYNVIVKEIIRRQIKKEDCKKILRELDNLIYQDIQLTNKEIDFIESP